MNNFSLENKWVKIGLTVIGTKVALIVIISLLVLLGIFSGSRNPDAAGGITPYFERIIISDITLGEALLLVLLGLISGTVGGMIGMGGGVLKIANLHLIMGFDLLLARIVSLLSYFVISISAFLMYRKYDLILVNVVKMLAPAAILGAIIGVIIGKFINKDYFELIIGIYALFSGVIILNQIWVRPVEDEISEIRNEEINETAVASIGIGMGVVSGLIGISGGIISTPMQQSILKLPLKNSIANTIATAIFCSFAASAFIMIVGLHQGDFSLGEALAVTTFLIPGNFLGGQLGGYLAKRLNTNTMRVIFALVAFVIGFRILT